MDYLNFKEFVREIAEAAAGGGQKLVAIPELRRSLSERLTRTDFDALVLRLGEEGHVRLLGHLDFGMLPESDQRDCLQHPTGAALYWIRWLT